MGEEPDPDDSAEERSVDDLTAGADVPVGDHDDDQSADGEPTIAEPGDPLSPDAAPSNTANTDGGETGNAFPAGTETGYEDEPSQIERKTGPEQDEELPLADHVEEMIKRLAIVVAVAGLVSVIVFPLGDQVINQLWYAVLPVSPPTPGVPPGRGSPHLYQPLELLITQFKVASLAGIIVALPVFVYETYAFMRPGLYPHERRYYLAAVPMSLILALLGLTFAYFVVLPAVFGYFYNYSQPVADIAFALSDTFNLILILMGYLALVFQIPLFIMLAIMMGLTTREWLQNRRLIFWGVFLGVSFFLTPDPTGVAPIFVAVTMVVLFEGTLLLLRWTGN